MNLNVKKQVSFAICRAKSANFVVETANTVSLELEKEIKMLKRQHIHFFKITRIYSTNEKIT